MLHRHCLADCSLLHHKVRIIVSILQIEETKTHVPWPGAPNWDLAQENLTPKSCFLYYTALCWEDGQGWHGGGRVSRTDCKIYFTKYHGIENQALVCWGGHRFDWLPEFSVSRKPNRQMWAPCCFASIFHFSFRLLICSFLSRKSYFLNIWSSKYAHIPLSNFGTQPWVFFCEVTNSPPTRDRFELWCGDVGGGRSRSSSLPLSLAALTLATSVLSSLPAPQVFPCARPATEHWTCVHATPSLTHTHTHAHSTHAHFLPPCSAQCFVHKNTQCLFRYGLLWIRFCSVTTHICFGNKSAVNKFIAAYLYDWRNLKII